MPRLLHFLHLSSELLANWNCQSQMRHPSHAILRTDRALGIEMTARRRFSSWRWRPARRKGHRQCLPWATGLAPEMGSVVEPKPAACPAAWVGYPVSLSHAAVAGRIQLRQQAPRGLAEGPPVAVPPASTCLCISRYPVSGNINQRICEGGPYIFNGSLAALHGTGFLQGLINIWPVLWILFQHGTCSTC